MGSRFVTCAISQHPISTQTPVVMVPIVMQPDNSLGPPPTCQRLSSKPLSLPLRGVYNKSSGPTLGKDDVGLPFLHLALSSLVEQQRLHTVEEGEPLVCKRLPKNLLQLLAQGRFTVTCHHSPKEYGWSSTTLPETVHMPLAMKFVHTNLYEALAAQVAGPSNPENPFDEKTPDLRQFKGALERELLRDLTMTPAMKRKYESMQATGRSEFDATIEEKAAFLRQTKPGVFELADHIYFSKEWTGDAIVQATLHNNAAIRQEFVYFTLFERSIDLLPKMWLPKANLRDKLTQELYQLVRHFSVSKL